MMTLIDIGNSRIKWARSGEDGPIDVRAVAYRDDPADAVAALCDDLGAGAGTVIGASVGDVDVRDALTDSLSRLGHTVRWLAVTRDALGVTCGYRNTERLGVDRWMASLAGFHRAPAAALVAQIGTAATIDAVAADGRHLGGMIFPGLTLMTEALYGQTARIRAGAEDLPDPTSRLEFFADDTDTAVQNGCLLAVAAAIDASYDALVLEGHDVTLFVAGGGAPALARHLAAPYRHEPALVLDGIRRIALAEPAHA